MIKIDDKINDLLNISSQEAHCNCNPGNQVSSWQFKHLAMENQHKKNKKKHRLRTSTSAGSNDYHRDCRFCRRLTKSCTVDCKNRSPFKFHDDWSEYMKDYKEKNSKITENVDTLYNELEHRERYVLLID